MLYSKQYKYTWEAEHCQYKKWYNKLPMRQLGLLLLTLAMWVGQGSPLCAEPRSAKVAGRFYPAQRPELLNLVSELLDQQPEPAISQKPRILIVPHAGYVYSGPVAARAYRHLRGHAYDGVVVVAFTHRIQFDGASVDTREAYQTPLGTLPLHQEAVALVQQFPGVRFIEEAHETDEHSLEVQLPFLQVALEEVKLVPILMGSSGQEDASHVAEALAAVAKSGDYLFIFTTDLSHYHPYAEAQAIDEGTVNALLFETPQAIHRLFDRGEIEACGRGPVVTSLLLAAKLGYPKRELFMYANSGDTAGNPSSVVGYAAIGMFDQPPVTAGRLSQEAGAALVKAARRSLERSLGKSEAAPAELAQYPELTRPSGVFVTLRKQGQLRGCIGRIDTDEPLAQSVPVVALDAALRDHRFSPVTAEELAELDVEVSVLTPPQKLTDPTDLVAGRDGVILEYEGRRGLFLPQVWDETGWTRVEFLRELASQKAGLPPDAWKQATLYTFQDQIFSE